MKKADTLLINGRFLTMEEDAPFAEAVAIRDGRILYVGDEEEARRFVSEDTEVIDLEGRVASPAFIESHTHPLGYANTLAFLNCRGENTESLENLLKCVSEYADKIPKGEWIYGTGYDEGKFLTGASDITRDDLDKVVPDHPVYLRRTCGHLCVMNSLAMKISNLSDEDNLPFDPCSYFRDEAGRLTGKFSTNAAAKAPIPKASPKQIEEGIFKVQEMFFKNGITTAADMSIGPANFKTIQKLDREKRIKLRFGIYHSADIESSLNGKGRLSSAANLSMQSGFGSDRLWFLGLKYVMDGAAGGRTAAFSLPYVNEPDNFGKLYHEQRAVNESVLTAAKAGIQASIHAIGDRAIEMALTAVEYANANGYDTKNLRFRIEHLEAPTFNHIERIKALNLSVSLSGAFIYSLGDSHINVMGEDRLIHAFPARTLMDMGITVACNSDCPVCDVNPMYGIYSMVTRTTSRGRDFGGKAEAVDRIKALEAYTKNAAYLLWRENELGTLKEGKLADIVVFDEDFLNVPDRELKDIHIYMTMSGGEVVYKNEKFKL